MGDAWPASPRLEKSGGSSNDVVPVAAMRRLLGAVGGIVAVAVFHLATFAIGGVVLILQIGAGVLTSVLAVRLAVRAIARCALAT